MEAGQEMGITPAITFIKEKEIYGHFLSTALWNRIHVLC
jgi:hypothetical protein